MKKVLPKPTEKELEILQILWKKGPSAVKDVHGALGGEDENGYTTILKLLQIMFEKGLVKREKQGKLHVYEATESLQNTQQQVVEKLISTVFQGSASRLVMSALGSARSSREEIEEIKKYLSKLEGGEQ